MAKSFGFADGVNHYDDWTPRITGHFRRGLGSEKGFCVSAGARRGFGGAGFEASALHRLAVRRARAVLEAKPVW